VKVLVSAFACSPYRGSEPGVGWGWVKAISEYHDLWVLTGRQFEGEIEQELTLRPKLRERIHFQFIARKRWLLLEKIWPPAYLWTYQLWQKEAYRLAVQLHREIGFDLVHQLTYVGFRVPGYLWQLGVPFVWGPIGGLENTPWRLLPMMGLRGAVYYGARNIVNSLHKRFLGLPKRAFAKAAASGAIIAATEGTRREIRRWYGCDSRVICEIGPPEQIATDCSVRSDGSPLRLAWSGLHEPGKALPLLLGALARLRPEVKWQLDILGDGPCTPTWKRLAQRLGMDSRCAWHGWLLRDKAVSIVHNSHAFVITSIKDLTSTVLLEALSQGVPVVCLDHCGFRDVVTDECGIRIPIQTPQQVIRDMADAIGMIWQRESWRRELAMRALHRVRAFSWVKKADSLTSLYMHAMARTQGLHGEECIRS